MGLWTYNPQSLKDVDVCCRTCITAVYELSENIPTRDVRMYIHIVHTYTRMLILSSLSSIDNYAVVSMVFFRCKCKQQFTSKG